VAGVAVELLLGPSTEIGNLKLAGDHEGLSKEISNAGIRVHCFALQFEH